MTNPPIQFPSTFAAANAVAFANPDNSAQTVSQDAPLPVAVTNLPAAQAISAASLPLPTGAATAAAQASAQTTLSAISAQLPASLGAKTGAASLSLTPASDLANAEPAGVAVTGTAMPAGGVGLTGWLSAIYRACSEGAAVAGSVTSATTVVSASNSRYMGGSFQVTSAGTTCTVSYEQSNDGTTWVALPVVSSAAATSAPVTAKMKTPT